MEVKIGIEQFTNPERHENWSASTFVKSKIESTNGDSVRRYVDKVSRDQQKDPELTSA